MAWTAAVVVVVSLSAYVAAGWYYAGQLLTPGGAALPDEPVTVEAVGDGTVTLERTADSARRGVYGLAYDGGYARVRRVLDRDGDSVRRIYRNLLGELAAGDQVSVDADYFPDDAESVIDFPLHEVFIDGELGAFPAWLDTSGQRGEDWSRLRARTGRQPG